MNLIHNDAEPRTFDSPSTMSTIASKAPLLQIDALHQQHSRLAKLPLTKCSQMFFNLDQLSLQCETPLQDS
jgi:hypothetical protein